MNTQKSKVNFLCTFATSVFIRCWVYVDCTMLATNLTADFSLTSSDILTASSISVTTLVKPLSEQLLTLLAPLRHEYFVYLGLFVQVPYGLSL